MRPAAQAAPQRQACAAISRPASMPLITKDAPEVAVDRGDEQCALDARSRHSADVWGDEQTDADRGEPLQAKPAALDV